jgi:hypothetical protein
MNTLKLKGRAPAPNTGEQQIRKPSLLDDLEELLAKEEASPPEPPMQPVVRLKSMDARNNPAGRRIFMMRRLPYANKSEYETAIVSASFGSLMQWYNAGVLDQYPVHAREFAELDIIDHVHEQNKKAFRNAHSLRRKHDDLMGLYEDEVVHEYEPGDYEYDRLQWQIEETENELFEVNAPDNYSRFTKFAHALECGIIQSPKATKLVTKAMLLALCDSIPLKTVRELPEGARGMLRRSVIAKSTELEDPGLIEALANIPEGSWLTEGTNEGIRQCANRLLSL